MKIDYNEFLNNILCCQNFTGAIRYDYGFDFLQRPELKKNVPLKIFGDNAYLHIQLFNAVMLCSMYKEKAISKKATKSNVAPELIENAALMISNKVGNKYYIGNIEFNSNLEVIEFIRNKLTHGDYYVQKDKMFVGNDEMKKNPSIVADIDIKNVISSVMIITQAELYYTDNRKSRIVTVAPKVFKGDNAVNENGIKNLCKKIYLVKFIDKTINGKKADSNYSNIVHQYIKNFDYSIDYEVRKKENENKSFKDIVRNYINVSKQVLKENNIDLRFEITNAYDCGKYEKIKKEFTSFEEWNTWHADDQTLTLSYCALEHYDPTFKEQKMRGAFFNNIGIIDYVRKHGEFSKDCKELLRVSNTYFDDITVASYLSLFYSFFHYGLENVYSKSSKTKLIDVVNNEALDFSKLDLDELYEPNMKEIVSFKPFKDEFISIEKDYLKSKKNYIEKVKNKQIYVNKNKESIKKEVLDKLNKAEEESYCLVVKREYEYRKAKEIMSRFDKFVKNYNIILNIRDAISHGNFSANIKIEKGKDAALDSILVFENKFENNKKTVTNYYKEIPLKKFISIFHPNNLEILENFIVDKTVKIPEVKEVNKTI